MTKLGKCLALYRVSIGYSLRDMADEMDISHATLKRIEDGNAPRADTLISLWIWLCEEEKNGRQLLPSNESR